MFQAGFQMAPISGNGFRPSLFNASVEQTRTFHPSLAGGSWLGQSSAEWYARAKASLARFDEILTRTARIANQTERNRILGWVGKASTQDTPAYRYATVKNDLQESVEAHTPPAIDAYKVTRLQHRIEKLENYNNEFGTMVSNAENVYGKLAEPVVIERERIVSTTGGETKTNWTLPLVIGGGAVAVAILVSALSGK